jgi:hypothetical protein
MTHLQITSVRVTTSGPDCCNGLVQAVGVGHRHHEETAGSIRKHAGRGGELYFARIDGVFVDVILGACHDCGEPFLWANADGTMEIKGESAADNALLRLPVLDEVDPRLREPRSVVTLAQPEPAQPARKRRWFSL